MHIQMVKSKMQLTCIFIPYTFNFHVIFLVMMHASRWLRISLSEVVEFLIYGFLLHFWWKILMLNTCVTLSCFIFFFIFRFLGYFQPQEGKPALWELDSDYYLHVSGIGDDLIPEYGYFIANFITCKISMADSVYLNCCPKTISNGYFWVGQITTNFFKEVWISSIKCIPLAQFILLSFFILGVRKFRPSDKGILLTRLSVFQYPTIEKVPFPSFSIKNFQLYQEATFSMDKLEFQ